MRAERPGLAIRILLGPLCLLSAWASAHSDAELDARQTAHGGQLRMAGALHLELVLAREGDAAQPRPIVVHVGNHADDPLPVAGADATVTLIAPGGQPIRVRLTPTGHSQLQAHAVYPDHSALKAAVRIRMPDQPTVQARFEPLRSQPAPAADAHVDGHEHGHEHGP